MEVISLIGIIAGIAFFILCCCKGIQMFLAALLASVIIIVFSGMPALETLTGAWASSAGGFITSYILIFVGGCLYGQTMAAGKGSRSIAVAFANVIRKSKRNQKLICVMFVPVMYMILTFVGINSFVIVFTVLYTARDLYQEIDVPWRLYCYGGACSTATCILGGSLQLVNIQLSEMYGTPLTAEMGLSIVGFAAFCLVFAVLAKFDIRKAERAGETFMDSGAAFANPEIGKKSDEQEDMPSAWYALISMAAVVVCAVTLHVLAGILIGILLNLLFFRKYMTDLNDSITTGITSSFGPALNAAATVGLSTLVATAPGFQIVTNALSNLSPLYFGPTVIALVTFLTAAPPGAVSAFGTQILESMTAAGYSAGVTHRILSASIFACVGPHSPGVVNTTMLARLAYKKAVPVYLKISLIPGVCSLLVMILCVQFGLFV